MNGDETVFPHTHDLPADARGMTMLEYFAGAALIGYLQMNPRHEPGKARQAVIDGIADYAWRIAEAMCRRKP